jgi:hypothetical protein
MSKTQIIFGIITALSFLSFYFIFRYKKKQSDDAILYPQDIEKKKILYTQLVKELEGRKSFLLILTTKAKIWIGAILLLFLLFAGSFLLFRGGFFAGKIIINRIISEPPYYFVVINSMANSEGAEVNIAPHKIKIIKIFPSAVVLKIDDKIEKKIQVTQPNMKLDCS